MLVEVFRSSRKQDTYLYLPRGASFDELPGCFAKHLDLPSWRCL